MNKIERKAMTAIYSCAHFFVDMSCAFIMLRYAYAGIGENLLVYNFCAFALQMPIGIILDRFGGGHRAASAGCGLIFAAYFFALAGINMPSAIIAGFGNALFHAGGGVYVLDSSDNSGALGVFVSPGAIGLYLGIVLGSGNNASCIIPMSAMLIFSAFIPTAPYILRIEDKCGTAASDFMTEKLPFTAFMAALLFFAVVVIRSFGGFALSFSWKVTPSAAFSAVLCTAGGKALGGFASDRFGKERAAAVSMTLAALLYLFSGNIVCGLGAILFFNMSMPITLKAAADIFKGGRGFSFGLLTFALFIGYIPSFTENGSLQVGKAMMCVLCIASVAMLLMGFRLQRQVKRSDGN